MSKIKAVIFDMDGVLIDSEPLHFQAEAEVLYEYGIILKETEQQELMGLTEKDFFTEVKRRHKIEVQTDTLIDQKRNKYEEYLKLKGVPFKDMVQATKDLNQRA